MKATIEINSLKEFIKFGRGVIAAVDNGLIDEDIEINLDGEKAEEEKPAEKPAEKKEAKPKKTKAKKEEPKPEPEKEEIIAPTEEVAETIEDVEPESEAEETEPESEPESASISDAEIRQAVIKCGKTYSREVLAEILGLYGVKTAADVPQDKRAEALRKLEAGDVNA